MKEYNKKEFLAPNSPRSCASYHAKTELNGLPKLVFRVNDCNKGALLINETTPDGIDEMIQKLTTLIDGAIEFRGHLIKQKYEQ